MTDEDDPFETWTLDRETILLLGWRFLIGVKVKLKSCVAFFIGNRTIAMKWLPLGHHPRRKCAVELQEL